MRGRGNLGGPAPSPFHDSLYYDTYVCADGRFVTVGAMEPQFYDLLLRQLGLDDVDRARQDAREDWPALKARIAAASRTRTRDAWCALLEGTDACFAPVLDMAEAAAHPHNLARGTFRAGAAPGELRPGIIDFKRNPSIAAARAARILAD